MALDVYGPRVALEHKKSRRKTVWDMHVHREAIKNDIEVSSLHFKEFWEIKKGYARSGRNPCWLICCTLENLLAMHQATYLFRLADLVLALEIVPPNPPGSFPWRAGLHILGSDWQQTRAWRSNSDQHACRSLSHTSDLAPNSSAHVQRQVTPRFHRDPYLP